MTAFDKNELANYQHNVLDATQNVHKVLCDLKVLSSLSIVSFSITLKYRESDQKGADLECA